MQQFVKLFFNKKLSNSRDAVQFNTDRVRILHGTGTGALRQAIREYLSTVPAVTSVADEDVRFGGAGITVVDFR